MMPSWLNQQSAFRRCVRYFIAMGLVGGVLFIASGCNDRPSESSMLTSGLTPSQLNESESPPSRRRDSQNDGQSVTPRPDARPPIEIAEDRSASRDAATRPLARSEPEDDTTPSGIDPVDPGAAVLIERIRTAIADGATADRTVEIALRRLRNQSRAPNDELELLQARLLTLLQPAGETSGIVVAAEESARTEYALSAAVYLVERDGVEYWEMFFALRPQGASWRIWKNAEPVRLERVRQMADSDTLEYSGSRP